MQRDAPEWCNAEGRASESTTRYAPPRTVGRHSREPPLTPLGLTSKELAQALGRYRLQLHALIRALGSGTPCALHAAASGALEDLDALIDVDAGARATPAGQARMSEVERSVLVPLLAQLHRRLAALARSAPSRDWIPLLQAADADVAQAEHAVTRR